MCAYTYKGLSISKVDKLSDFLSMKDEWNQLLHQSESDNPFLTFEWISSWWKYFSGNGKLFILLLRDRDCIIAIAPLMILRKSIFRVLQFIGTGRSDYLDFIIAKRNQEVLNSIFAYIYACRMCWDIIDLRDILSTSPNVEAIESTIKDTHLLSSRVTNTVAPYISRNGSWDQYLGGKSKSFRRDLRRNESSIRKAGDLEFFCQRQAISNQIEIIHQIEQRSWKADAGSARLATENARGFYSEILQNFSNEGWLELWILSFNQKPIAYNVNFLYKNRVYLYNGTYMEEYREFSPGMLITARMVEDALNRGVDEFDFLRGDEEYKFRWTQLKRDLYQIAACSNSPYSIMGFLTMIKIRWALREYSLIQKLNTSRVKYVQKLRKIIQSTLSSVS